MIRIFLSFTFICAVSQILAQQTISGYVFDKESSERLIGAYVKSGTNNVVATDNNGFFSLKADTDALVEVSFVGYNTLQINVQGRHDTLLNVYLKPGHVLEEVIVVGKRNEKHDRVTMNAQQLRAVPLIGAKSDVLKALEVIPGIEMQQEASSLLSVRGGEPGQNLYLLDGVPIIHVHHLGGFFSVFNPDIINSIDVYKGAFPAKFGGKLSSIIDISQREGDKHKLKGSLSVGLTDISGTIEGPAFFKNSSFIFTARKTLIDGLMALSNVGSEDNSFIYMYGFHDINGKFSWRMNPKHSFYFSLYQGDDYLRYWSKKAQADQLKSKMKTVWGNWFASARWIYSNASSLTGNQTLSYMSYRLMDKQTVTFYGGSQNETLKNEVLSTVGDLSFRSAWKYQPVSWFTLGFGGQLSYYRHHPNQVTRSIESNSISTDLIHSYETSLYVDGNWQLGSRLSGTAGFRASEYFNGKYHYFSPEPRLQVGYQLLENMELNVGYMYASQFSHLIITDGNVMSNEIWIPANRNIKPSNVNQLSFGANTTLFNNMFNVGATVYEKQMRNLVNAPEGYSTVIGDPTFDSKILSGGTGSSRGVEFYLRKQLGDFTGSMAYSYTYAQRKHSEMNNGKPYVPDFDRPHNANVNVQYKLTDKFSLSANFTIKSGAPYTPVIGRQYYIDPNGDGALQEAFIYGERNSARMKAYHRLDLGMVYERINKRGNRTEWTFSVYNVYNRQNPSLYYYATNGSEEGSLDDFHQGNYLDKELYQVSFFTIIPAFSYKVYFDGHNFRNREGKGDRNMLQYFNDWMQYEH